MYNLIIVDDESYILDQLKDVFPWETMSFNLIGCFTNARDALICAQQNHVDVLLTDIKLGNDTGLDLAVGIRRENPDIELVIISAYSDFEYARSALRINVHDYLLKPVTYAGVTDCFGGLKQKLEMRGNIGKTDPPSDGGSEDNYRIAIVKQYIEKHVGDDITLEGIAGLISMNPAYFSRFFKRHTGLLFAEYLAGRRMEMAIRLLKDPANKVFEISCKVGYLSKKNFYKRFRQYTGRTPSEYRNEVLNIGDFANEE